ncbi:MAG: EFR1 family ferrodoxin [Paludibacteraceae bacterium]|nr:EFR1 family ferrodoxin [Paludibacteraceae bacterium]
MIFYFSATGNSKWVASQLAFILGESLVSINDVLKKGLTDCRYQLSEDERIGFVFPVHSWGVPTLVLKFIKHLELQGYENHQVFAVCTCGDDAGYTNSILRKALKKKGLPLDQCFTVQMPNTYIVFPFFDVDSQEVETEKLENAQLRIKKISKEIVDGINNKSLYHKGVLPFLKTRLIYPIFKKCATGKTKFHASNRCTRCGLCKDVCPTLNIKTNNGLPYWGNNCVQCLACIHHCPVKAIDYGEITVKKGRYHFKRRKNG